MALRFLRVNCNVLLKKSFFYDGFHLSSRALHFDKQQFPVIESENTTDPIPRPTFHNSFESQMAQLNDSVDRLKLAQCFFIQKVVEALQHQDNPDPRAITRILSATGSLAADAKPETRMKIVNSVWDIVNKKDVPLNVHTYNSLLKSLLDNEAEFDPAAKLEEMYGRGILPNRETYIYLMQKYCESGDMEKANEILAHMKEDGMRINEDVLSTVTNGYILANRTEDASSTISTMSQFGIKPTWSTYLAIMMAHAERGKLSDIKAYLDTAESGGEGLKPGSMAQVYTKLAMKGFNKEAAEMLTWIPREGNFHDFNSMRNNIWQLILHEQHQSALDLFYHIPLGKMSKEVCKNTLKLLTKSNAPAPLVGAFLDRVREKITANRDFLTALLRNKTDFAEACALAIVLTKEAQFSETATNYKHLFYLARRDRSFEEVYTALNLLRKNGIKRGRKILVHDYAVQTLMEIGVPLKDIKNKGEDIREGLTLELMKQGRYKEAKEIYHRGMYGGIVMDTLQDIVEQTVGKEKKCVTELMMLALSDWFRVRQVIQHASKISSEEQVLLRGCLYFLKTTNYRVEPTLRATVADSLADCGLAQDEYNFLFEPTVPKRDNVNMHTDIFNSIQSALKEGKNTDLDSYLQIASDKPTILLVAAVECAEQGYLDKALELKKQFEVANPDGYFTRVWVAKFANHFVTHGGVDGVIDILKSSASRTWKSKKIPNFGGVILHNCRRKFAPADTEKVFWTLQENGYLSTKYDKPISAVIQHYFFDKNNEGASEFLIRCANTIADFKSDSLAWNTVKTYIKQDTLDVVLKILEETGRCVPEAEEVDTVGDDAAIAKLLGLRNDKAAFSEVFVKRFGNRKNTDFLSKVFHNIDPSTTLELIHGCLHSLVIQSKMHMVNALYDLHETLQLKPLPKTTTYVHIASLLRERSFPKLLSTSILSRALDVPPAFLESDSSEILDRVVKMHQPLDQLELYALLSHITTRDIHNRYLGDVFGSLAGSEEGAVVMKGLLDALPNVIKRADLILVSLKLGNEDLVNWCYDYLRGHHDVLTALVSPARSRSVTSLEESKKEAVKAITVDVGLGVAFDVLRIEDLLWTGNAEEAGTVLQEVLTSYDPEQVMKIVVNRLGIYVNYVDKWVPFLKEVAPQCVVPFFEHRLRRLCSFSWKNQEMYTIFGIMATYDVPLKTLSDHVQVLIKEKAILEGIDCPTELDNIDHDKSLWFKHLSEDESLDVLNHSKLLDQIKRSVSMANIPQEDLFKLISLSIINHSLLAMTTFLQYCVIEGEMDVAASLMNAAVGFSSSSQYTRVKAMMKALTTDDLGRLDLLLCTTVKAPELFSKLKDTKPDTFTALNNIAAEYGIMKPAFRLAAHYLTEDRVLEAVDLVRENDIDLFGNEFFSVFSKHTTMLHGDKTKIVTYLKSLGEFLKALDAEDVARNMFIAFQKTYSGRNVVSAFLNNRLDHVRENSDREVQKMVTALKDSDLDEPKSEAYYVEEVNRVLSSGTVFDLASLIIESKMNPEKLIDITNEMGSTRGNYWLYSLLAEIAAKGADTEVITILSGLEQRIQDRKKPFLWLSKVIKGENVDENISDILEQPWLTVACLTGSLIPSLMRNCHVDHLIQLEDLLVKGHLRNPTKSVKTAHNQLIAAYIRQGRNDRAAALCKPGCAFYVYLGGSNRYPLTKEEFTRAHAFILEHSPEDNHHYIEICLRNTCGPNPHANLELGLYIFEEATKSGLFKMDRCMKDTLKRMATALESCKEEPKFAPLMQAVEVALKSKGVFELKRDNEEEAAAHV